MRRFDLTILTWLLATLLWPAAAFAHQPVMDMAPRWQGGFGFQLRHQYNGSSVRLRGDGSVDNSLRLSRHRHETWFEGVYTFLREVRLTAKLPLVHERRVLEQDGEVSRHSSFGMGDMVAAMLFKHYYNEATHTGNFSVTPQLRLPTGSVAEGTGDGSFDPGLSISFSAENTQVFQLYDVFYFHNTAGDNSDRGDLFGLDVNVGLHPYHSNADNAGLFVLADFSLRHELQGFDRWGTTGGSRLSIGPVLMPYRENVMARFTLKIPIYQHVYGEQFAHGVELHAGVGAAF